jgi:hypothetical protein
MPSPHGRRTRCSCAVRLSLNPAAHEMQNQTFADGASIHCRTTKIPRSLVMECRRERRVSSWRINSLPEQTAQSGWACSDRPSSANPIVARRGLAFFPNERSRTILVDGPQLRSEVRSVGPSPIANVCECACFHGRIPANCFCARMRDRGLPCAARSRRTSYRPTRQAKPV